MFKNFLLQLIYLVSSVDVPEYLVGKLHEHEHEHERVWLELNHSSKLQIIISVIKSNELYDRNVYKSLYSALQQNICISQIATGYRKTFIQFASV